ncbi:hypothetical protein Droror1_Dr00009287 [Drosera rotundifolia]
MVMIKDNYVSIAGGVANALKSVDSYLQQNNLQMEVEVETRTMEEVKEVLGYASENKTHLTRIMLDNMVAPHPYGDVDVSMLEEAVEIISGRFETEELYQSCYMGCFLRICASLYFEVSSIIQHRFLFETPSIISPHPPLSDIWGGGGNAGVKEEIVRGFCENVKE